MGNLEREAKKARVYRTLGHAVLATFGVAGILAVGAVAPNAIQLLGQFGSRKRSAWKESSAERAFYRLVGDGYIRIEKTDRGKFARLTENGKKHLEQLLLRTKNQKRPWRWDRRWRMVTYDIQEYRRYSRVKISRILQSYGFYKLQASVWVFPYDCEDLITLLKTDNKIGKNLLYAIIEKLEYDAPIREYFGLPRE